MQLAPTAGGVVASLVPQRTTVGAMDLRRFFIRPAIRLPIERYARTHQNRVNQALHYVGIPLAVVAFLGALAKVRVTA